MLNRKKTVCSAVCISNIYNLISQGKFPGQIELGTRSVGWVDIEVDKWLSLGVKLRDRMTVTKGFNDKKNTFFWQFHGQDGLKPEQTKVLNRLLDAGLDGFEGCLTAGKYQRMAKVSKATATRHITDLLEKQCICKLEGGGRSTHYEINWP